MDSFINMGVELGKSKKEAKKAYLKAKKIEKDLLAKKLREQNIVLKSNYPKVLLVSHPKLVNCNLLYKTSISLTFSLTSSKKIILFDFFSIKKLL